MDRTKEFLSIVQITNIPQHPPQPTSFYPEIFQTQKKIEDLFSQISKVTNYESYRATPLIKNCTDLMERLKRAEINENVTRDYFTVASNLKSMVETKWLTYQLKLNELKRKTNKNESKAVVESIPENRNIRNERNERNELIQDTVLMEETEQEQSQEHRRVLKSITEIGQIIGDISLHVKLQEEQLKRIDDIVVESDRWLKKTTGELLDYWEMIRSGRGKMVKYFGFFAVVVVLFWMIRK